MATIFVSSVQVMLFADRLEVWNPGELPLSLTLDELRRPHASIPRNPLIAEPLFLARYAEKAGTGILDMIARCRDAGLPRPPRPPGAAGGRWGGLVVVSGWGGAIVARQRGAKRRRRTPRGWRKTVPDPTLTRGPSLS
ncbi:MAG: hypothetical protein HY812_15235 [Planctomycetes bacterium]|nr:hypothetical protein [Planctomycetota bacterium]